MEFITGKHISRRTMLRGMGTAIGLPLLDAMVPANKLWAATEAGQLRRNVTSEGGTTAAALAVLQADDGLQPLFDRALLAARERGRELDS